MSAGTFNIIGVVVLLVGLGSAGLVYRNRPATPTTTSDWKDSSLTVTDSKISTRNIELYGGKIEVLMVKYQEGLRHPTVLAIICGTLSILIALGCFFVAHHLKPYRRLRPG